MSEQDSDAISSDLNLSSENIPSGSLSSNLASSNNSSLLTNDTDNYSACSIDVAAALLAAKKAAQNVLASAARSSTSASSSSMDSRQETEEPIPDFIKQTTEDLRIRQNEIASQVTRYSRNNRSNINIPYPTNLKYPSGCHVNSPISVNSIIKDYDDRTSDTNYSLQTNNSHQNFEPQKPYSFIFEERVIHRKTEIDASKRNSFGKIDSIEEDPEENHFHENPIYERSSEENENRRAIEQFQMMNNSLKASRTCFISQLDLRDLTPPRPQTSSNDTTSSDDELSLSSSQGQDFPFVDDADDERELTPPQQEIPWVYEKPPLPPLPPKLILPTIIEDSASSYTSSNRSYSPDNAENLWKEESPDYEENDELDISFESVIENINNKLVEIFNGLNESFFSK